MKKLAILTCLAALAATGIIQILYGVSSASRIDSHYRGKITETAARSNMPTETIGQLAGHISEMEAMWDRPILVGALTLAIAGVAFVLCLRRNEAQPSDGANTA